MIRGTILKYGDNINTDIISPAKYMELPPEEQGKYAMSKVDPDFYQRVQKSPIVIGGSNFGNGSSRETAPIALKAAGVELVIAKFFARIFFRNCINIGLAVMELKEVDAFSTGDEIEVDLESGRVTHVSTGDVYQGTKLPSHIVDIVRAGGLIPFIQSRRASL